MHIPHESQCVRADHDAREEESDQRRDLQPMRQQHRGNRDGDEHDEVPQDWNLFHAA